MTVARDVMQRGATGAIFRNGSFDVVAQWLLGCSQQGGLPPGALLDAFARIRDGSPASWTRVFTALAERWESHARLGASPAAHAWACTSQAWRAAMFWSDPRTPSAQAAARAMTAAFREHLRHLNAPLVPVRIPFADASLPGYVSRDLADANRVLVVVGGGDTYVEDLYSFGGRAALASGWAVAMVDLPGQGNTPASGLHFGPGTLDGLRATLDHLRSAGFGGAIALLGWSGGGIFTTKYASVARPEDRIRALVASAPIHDPVRMFERALPRLLTTKTAGRLAAAASHLARLRPTLRVALDKYGWQFGPLGIGGVVKTFGALGTTTLADLDVPVLALVGDDEDAESRVQAEETVAAVVARHPGSQVRRYGSWTGASAHCQVGSLTSVLDEVLSWLDDQLPSPARIVAG